MNIQKNLKNVYIIPILWGLMLGFLFLPARAFAADLPQYNTIPDAASYIRSQMLDHEETICFQFPQKTISESAPDFDTFVGILSTEVYKYDPSNPAAGDYLERSIEQAFYSTSSLEDDQMIEIRCNITYKMSAEEEQYVSAEIPKILSALSVSNKSDAEKIEAIYSYICQTVSFKQNTDETNQNYETAYSALYNHCCNCQGYATLLYRMFLSAGVESRIIFGTCNSLSHVWNIAKCNGYWYSFDATKECSDNVDEDYKYYMIPGKAYNDDRYDSFASYERSDTYTGDFYNSYPMMTFIPKEKTKAYPSFESYLLSNSFTIKYKSLKKKNITVTPYVFTCDVWLSYQIVPSKYSKYFSVTKTGKIRVKKVTKKNKPKKKTYTFTLKVTTMETTDYYPLTNYYKVKIKIK